MVGRPKQLEAAMERQNHFVPTREQALATLLEETLNHISSHTKPALEEEKQGILRREEHMNATIENLKKLLDAEES